MSQEIKVYRLEADNKDSIRLLIKQLRLEADISQTKLAAKADLNPATISHIESGRKTLCVKIAEYQKIARALGVAFQIY